MSWKCVQVPPVGSFQVLAFTFIQEARQLIPPNRVRYPTDWSFASGCSPPHLTVTQLPSATGLDVTLDRTFTNLACNAHRRTRRVFQTRINKKCAAKCRTHTRCLEFKTRVYTYSTGGCRTAYVIFRPIYKRNDTWALQRAPLQYNLAWQRNLHLIRVFP